MWREGLEQVNDAFLEYYKDLMDTTISDRVRIKEEVFNIGPKITAEHLAYLERPYSVKEIKDTIMSIPGDKSPD